MQNFDYYSGSTHSQELPDFVVRDPEYFSRMARNQQKEGIKKRNKATRFLSLVLGLCIAAFTSGLIVGIKFSGGNDKEIVDPSTRKAMNDIGSRVTGMVEESSTDSSTQEQPAAAALSTDTTDHDNNSGKSFPKEIYPYVIRIGNKFTVNDAQEIADYLSNKGHTVILSKHQDFYRVYTGPYKEKSKAQNALTRINYYTDNKFFHSALVLER